MQDSAAPVLSTIPTTNTPAEQLPPLRIADPDGGEPPAQRPPKRRRGRKERKGRPVITEQRDAPDNPHVLAAKYLREVSDDGPIIKLRSWRDEFWQWRRGYYRRIETGDAKKYMAEWLRDEFVRLNKEEVAEWLYRKLNGQKLPTKKIPETREVTRDVVANVLQALGGMTVVPASTDAPAWVDGEPHPDPRNIFAVSNGLLDISGETPKLMPHTPALLSVGRTEYPFDPAAECPNWTAFLQSVWPDDAESVGTLQELMGYLLTTDIRQHKVFALIGPRRSGKGTIADVMTALAGESNVVSPMLSGLGGRFGLQPLLGKSVALVREAKVSGRADAEAITANILSVSGGDIINIDRKNLPAVDARLTTRFVLFGNEFPSIGDASSALAGRLILLRMTQSFFGREDIGLGARLQSELPGILNWSLAGLQRLRERGRFVQPAGGLDMLRQVEECASPVKVFVEDRCEVGAGYRVPKDDLFRVWGQHCRGQNIKDVGDLPRFSKALMAAYRNVESVRAVMGGKRVWVYDGIQLIPAGNLNETAPHEQLPTPAVEEPPVKVEYDGDAIPW